MSVILVAEQDASYAERIADVLQSEGWVVERVASRAEALRSAAAREPALLLASASLPEASSLLATFSRGQGGPGAVVLVPEVASSATASEYLADLALARSSSDEELKHTVRQCLTKTPAAVRPPPNAGRQLTSADIFGDVLAEVEAEAQRAKQARRAKTARSQTEDIERKLEETLSGVISVGTSKPTAATDGSAGRAPSQRPMPTEAEVDDLLDKTLSSLELPSRPKPRAAASPPIAALEPSPVSESPSVPEPSPTFEVEDTAGPTIDEPAPDLEPAADIPLNAGTTEPAAAAGDASSSGPTPSAPTDFEAAATPTDFEETEPAIPIQAPAAPSPLVGDSSALEIPAPAFGAPSSQDSLTSSDSAAGSWVAPATAETPDGEEARADDPVSFGWEMPSEEAPVSDPSTGMDLPSVKRPQPAASPPGPESEAPPPVEKRSIESVLGDADLTSETFKTQRLPMVVPTEDAVLEGGQRFGEYTLLERVAVGGMAEVWRARRRGVEGFQKTVAIKKILAHLIDSPDFVKMFIDEAKLAAQLTHNNIIQIYDLGKVGEDFYIAMEFVEGKDLRSILNAAKEQHRPLPLELALLIVGALARALDYAHRKRDFDDRELGLVHRDVSPQNVMISYEGEIKLCDFGIVKAVSKASTTQMGALKGKLQYMSPEQAWGRSVDARSDIFSLASVLFELLTGTKLFAGDSEIGVLDAVRECRVRSPRESAPSVPEEVERIVLKALAKSPEDRYETAGEMEHEIKSVLDSLQPTPAPKDLAGYLELLFRRDHAEDGWPLEVEPAAGLTSPAAGSPAAGSPAAGAPELRVPDLGTPTTGTLPTDTLGKLPAEEDSTAEPAASQVRSTLRIPAFEIPDLEAAAGSPAATSPSAGATSPVAEVARPAEGPEGTGSEVVGPEVGTREVLARPAQARPAQARPAQAPETSPPPDQAARGKSKLLLLALILAAGALVGLWFVLRGLPPWGSAPWGSAPSSGDRAPEAPAVSAPAAVQAPSAGAAGPATAEGPAAGPTEGGLEAALELGAESGSEADPQTGSEAAPQSGSEADPETAAEAGTEDSGAFPDLEQLVAEEVSKRKEQIDRDFEERKRQLEEEIEKAQQVQDPPAESPSEDAGGGVDDGGGSNPNP